MAPTPYSSTGDFTSALQISGAGNDPEPWSFFYFTTYMYALYSLMHNTIHMYSGITSGRVLDGELLYTKILEVNSQHALLSGEKSL